MKKTLILLSTVFALVLAFSITALAAEAKIGEQEYDTLAEAIAAANDGDEVILLSNVTVSSPIAIDKPLTLDGNSFKITATDTTVDCRAINVKTDGEVKIENLTVEAYGERAINIIQKPAILTIANVTAIAKNYAINVAGSSVGSTILVVDSNLTGASTVNISGSNTNVEIQNTIIICNDDKKAESYGAITIGSGVSNATVAVYGGEVIVSGDSTATANFSTSSTITFEGTIGVDKTMEIVAMIGLAGFETLAEAIEYAKNGQTVTLIKDVTLDSMIQIENAITLDLNGKKVTATCQKAFEVYADATIKNGSIEAVQRCVDTRTAVELTLEDLTLVADKYTSAYRNPQPLTIGGATNGTVVTMNNVKAYSGESGYCIISFVETDLTATNCDFYGYSTLYVKPGSEGSEFNFVGSTIRSDLSKNDVEGNSFAAIAVCTNNVAVSIDATSTVDAIGKNAFAFGLGNVYDTPIVEGVKVESSATIEGNILDADSLEDNAVKVPAEYSEKLADEGFLFETNDDGTISLTKPATKLSEVFGYKGTSTSGTSVTTGYTINHDKLEAYMAENGISSVEFGGVMAAGSINAYAKYFDFTNLAKTSNYNIIIRDVTEEYYDLALVMTLYVSFDGEEKKFVDNEANLVDKTEAPTITYNEAKGDEE